MTLPIRDLVRSPRLARSFTPGYRPPDSGKDALVEGEALIVIPDKVMCFGVGDGAYIELDLGGSSGAGDATPAIYPITGVASFAVSHGRSYAPDTWLVTAFGEEVEADVSHSPGAVTVTFAQPFIGTLFLR